MNNSADDLKNNMSTTKVVFFDDVCILCNSTVHFLIKADQKKKLRYAALSSQYLKTIPALQGLEIDRSIIFWDGHTAFTEASAIAEILKALEGAYGLLGHLLKLCPKFISNLAYKLISRNRYRIFGKMDQCLIPNKEIKSLFLD